MVKDLEKHHITRVTNFAEEEIKKYYAERVTFAPGERSGSTPVTATGGLEGRQS